MKWTKASEQLPPYPDDPGNHYRLNGRKVHGNFFTDLDGMIFFSVRGFTHETYIIGKPSFVHLEWLDETEPSLTTDDETKLQEEADKLYPNDSNDMTDTMLAENSRAAYISGRRVSYSIQKEMGLLLMDKDGEIEALKGEVEFLSKQLKSCFDSHDISTQY